LGFGDDRLYPRVGGTVAMTQSKVAAMAHGDGGDGARRRLYLRVGGAV
jgi:hypothetical protein